jgi:hypothetical protein
MTAEADLKHLIGKRLLFQARYGIWRPLTECVLLEISPSGKFIKLKYAASENSEWEDKECFFEDNELVETDLNQGDNK